MNEIMRKIKVNRCDKFLHYSFLFKEFDNLHSAIIFLKPNEARLTSSFEYCITELLNFFPKDFAKNISEFGFC